MQRISSQKPGLRDIALQGLAWITCAKRPLTQLELQHALAVEPGTTQLDEENLPDIQGMVSACCGLVTIENESSIIRLVHYTTQEYFERTQVKWFPNAEAEIAIVCITYLSFEVFEAGLCRRYKEISERLLSHPFYGYAAQHWGHHTCGISFLSDEILRFLESRGKVEAAGQALLYPKFVSGVMGPTNMIGLHLAAYFGLDVIMKSLLESGTKDPNSAVTFKLKGDMAPLSYAAQMGHEAVVKPLLEMDNVNPDAKPASDNDFGRTPLSYAAEHGHESIVELLINTGQVDINKPEAGMWGGVSLLSVGGLTPLCVAAQNGHYDIVEILLDHGADAGYKGPSTFFREGKTALDRATENGHEAIVKLLLERTK